MSDELVVEACMNCKNYIPGLCLHLNHWVEADDWCGAWERLEQTVESDAMATPALSTPFPGRG
jgi:hypothetical protein